MTEAGGLRFGDERAVGGGPRQYEARTSGIRVAERSGQRNQQARQHVLGTSTYLHLDVVQADRIGVAQPADSAALKEDLCGPSLALQPKILGMAAPGTRLDAPVTGETNGR